MGLVTSVPFPSQEMFNKSYDERLEPLRRLAWEENLLKVHIHNAEAANGLHNYTLRENHLADMVRVRVGP